MGRQKRLSFFLWVRDCAIKQLQKHHSLAPLAVASMLPLTAHAANFTVDTLSDTDADGDTLREAIISANGTEEADTITFAPGLSGTLTLTQGQLVIDADLAINGPAERITISGDNSSRIFDTSISSVSLSNLIMTGGNQTGGSEELGGAIRMREGELVLTNCEVSNSSCSGIGGGIGCSSGGILTLVDSVVSNNSAAENGGGIGADDFELTLTNCEISDNISNSSGGGISAEIDNTTASLTLSNCMITGNVASTPVDDSAVIQGGGIDATGFDELTISNSVISQNSAIAAGAGGIGGGLHFSNISSLSIENSQISNNECSLYAGGIRSSSVNEMNISNTLISENQGGSGLSSYLDDFVTLTNCTIAGNDASGSYGGGICAYGTAGLFVNNCSITANSAIRGGGIGATDDSSVQISNSICAFNDSVGSNEDLFLSNSSITLGGRNLFSDNMTSPGMTTIGLALFNGQIIESDPANVFAETSVINEITTGTLADNGGPTPTILLLSAGAAHNTGLNSALPSDEQDLDNDEDTTEDLPIDALGLARVSGSSVDLGAVEIDQSSSFLLNLVEIDEEGSVVLSFELSQALGSGDAWIISRSLDLENFDPIFAFDGTTVVLQEDQNISNLEENTYTITDTSPPQQKAFYSLQIGASPTP